MTTTVQIALTIQNKMSHLYKWQNGLETNIKTKYRERLADFDVKHNSHSLR